MKSNGIATSFGLPFLVTLIGIGPVALLGSCDDVTTCEAKSFAVGPIILIAVLITGFVAGRMSASNLLGLVAVAAGAGVVVGVIEVGGLWYQAPDPDGTTSGLATWGFLTGLAVLLTLPGFAIGRSRRRVVAIAGLDARREAGTLRSDEYARELAMGGWKTSQDQAPSGHRCGRCAKPLSPVWHGKCKHCGARYAEYPPVPRIGP